MNLYVDPQVIKSIIKLLNDEFGIISPLTERQGQIQL